MPTINQLVRKGQKDYQYDQVIGSSKESTETWCVHPCIYDKAQETKFCFA